MGCVWGCIVGGWVVSGCIVGGCVGGGCVEVLNGLCFFTIM